MSNETAQSANGWSLINIGSQLIPVHCGRQAMDLDLGEWECGRCDSVVHVRQIPGWPVRRTLT